MVQKQKIKLSQHSIQRISERLEIENAQELVNNAWVFGKSIKYFKGDINDQDTIDYDMLWITSNIDSSITGKNIKYLRRIDINPLVGLFDIGCAFDMRKRSICPAGRGGFISYRSEGAGLRARPGAHTGAPLHLL